MNPRFSAFYSLYIYWNRDSISFTRDELLATSLLIDSDLNINHDYNLLCHGFSINFVESIVIPKLY
jgi:hypothetical protein